MLKEDFHQLPRRVILLAADPHRAETMFPLRELFGGSGPDPSVTGQDDPAVLTDDRHPSEIRRAAWYLADHRMAGMNDIGTCVFPDEDLG